jgi:hypothetical protein
MCRADALWSGFLRCSRKNVSTTSKPSSGTLRGDEVQTLLGGMPMSDPAEITPFSDSLRGIFLWPGSMSGLTLRT